MAGLAWSFPPITKSMPFDAISSAASVVRPVFDSLPTSAVAEVQTTMLIGRVTRQPPADAARWLSQSGCLR
jgi:hypothetical protein